MQMFWQHANSDRLERVMTLDHDVEAPQTIDVPHQQIA
jgi:hypothetical protein